MLKLDKYICIFLIPIFLLYSCTFTYKKPAADIDSYYEKINSYSKEYNTYLTLISEDEYRVKDLVVQRDSTSFLNVDSNIFYKIGTTEVKCVEFTDASAGAIGGLLMGLLGGLIIGISAFFISTGGDTSPEDMSGLIIIAGPLLGGSVGLVIGGLKQDRKIYYLNGWQ